MLLSLLWERLQPRLFFVLSSKTKSRLKPLPQVLIKVVQFWELSCLLLHLGGWAINKKSANVILNPWQQIYTEK